MAVASGVVASSGWKKSVKVTCCYQGDSALGYGGQVDANLPVECVGKTDRLCKGGTQEHSERALSHRLPIDDPSY